MPLGHPEIPGLSEREEVPGKTQDTLVGLCLVLDHLRVPLEELEEVTRARHAWTSLLRLLPL